MVEVQVQPELYKKGSVLNKESISPTVQWTVENQDVAPNLDGSPLKEHVFSFTEAPPIHPLLFSDLPWFVESRVFFSMKRIMSHSEELRPLYIFYHMSSNVTQLNSRNFFFS